MTKDNLISKFNTLNDDQIQQFIENYADRIVDDMDTKTLMQFAYDVIVENLSRTDREDLLEEISCVYDEETVGELLESVTV